MSLIPQPGTPRASLAHAAECLAKAAVALADAAQNLASAAELLTPNNVVSSPQDSNIGETAQVNKLSLGNSEVSSRDPRPTQTGTTENMHPRTSGPGPGQGSPNGQPVGCDQEYISPTSTTPLATTVRSNKTTPDRAYRMLLEDEVDVLLATCAIISRFQKVICYMCCSIPMLGLYQRLISDVTEIPVQTIHEVTSVELEYLGRGFLAETRSVLLLPESTVPAIELNTGCSCVVHMGWPANETSYKDQIEAHQANSSILVAYTDDQNLYSAGAAIVQETQPWPKDVESFKVSMSVLRPLFNQKLAEIPHKVKEKIYSEWIDLHGPHGWRHVSTWTPSALAYRANLYLLDALRYDFPGSSVLEESALQVPLPKVPAAFVKRQGLEAAVEEGVIQVEEDNSNPDQSLQTWSTGHSRSTTSETTTQVGSFTNPRFEPTPGHTFFSIGEEFDAIPLICFLILQYDKVVCFFDDQGALGKYREMVGKIVGHPIITPERPNDEAALEDAAIRFINHTPTAALLLSLSTKNLPISLRQNQIGCCIYWGFHLPLKQARKHRPQLGCTSSVIILTTTQRNKLSDLKYAIDIEEHPSSGTLLDLSSNSLLSPFRDATMSFLLSNKRIAKSLHGAREYFFFRIPRKALSAEEAAKRVNQYTSRVLLHGNPEDGSNAFPPIAGRFPTKARVIAKYNLETAAEAGLLDVE